MRITRFISPLLKIAFSAAMFLSLLILPVAAQTAVGYVQEIRGDWYLVGNSSQTLRQGQKLFAAGVVKRQSSSPDDRLIIANLRGEITGESRRCDEQNCSQSIRLPNGNPPQSYVGEAYRAVMNLIWGSPGRYSIHRSRGEELPNGIVKFEKGKIDFGSILKTTGKYHLRWRAVAASDKTETGDWLETTTTEVGEKQPAIAAAEKLKPGLYEVNLLRKRGANLEATPDYAWIFISAAADYEKNSRAFREAVETTEKWDGKVKSETVNIFLQAALDNLARQNARTNK